MIKARGDGIQIQLAIWEGKGKEILCIHGITANCRFWDCLASALVPHHKIIAMDLRGRGLSDKPPTGYSIYGSVYGIPEAPLNMIQTEAFNLRRFFSFL